MRELSSTTARRRLETRELTGSDLLSTPPPPPPRAQGAPRAVAKGTRGHLPIEEFGPFLVFEKLGQGGMAVVHRAERRAMGGFRKPLALKRLLHGVESDPMAVSSFLHEAKLASHLQHPNIARAYDAGRVHDTYYLAMELVPGPTLKQVMVQSESAAGAIPIPIVVEILIQLCDALDHAHNLCDATGKPLGIIHRDVTPANVIVSSSGTIKLIDFGIAKAATSRNTAAGIIKGKFGYLAPEYLAGTLDARADLFSLGIVAHEMLVGRPLFEGGGDYETVCNVRDMAIPLPSRTNRQVSRDLDDIVMLALQRDTSQRWQSARAMRTALANVAHDLGNTVGSQQIREWTEWAFTREPRHSTSIARLISAIEGDFHDEEPSIIVAPPTVPDLPSDKRRALRSAPTLPAGPAAIVRRDDDFESELPTTLRASTPAPPLPVPGARTHPPGPPPRAARKPGGREGRKPALASARTSAPSDAAVLPPEWFHGRLRPQAMRQPTPRTSRWLVLLLVLTLLGAAAYLGYLPL